MRSRFDRLLRVAPPIVISVTAGIVLVMLASRPDKLAHTFGLDPAEASGYLVGGCLAGAIAAFLAAAFILIRALIKSGREFVAWRKRNEPGQGFAEAGVVIVEFALIAPTVWLIMAMVVQLAIIYQATIVVRYAAYAAARSAVVRLERDFIGAQDVSIDPDKVKETAKLILCSLSPKTPGTDNDSAHAMYTMFAAQAAVWGDKSFYQRYQYADGATTVDTVLTDPPIEIPLSGGSLGPNIFAPKLVECDVTYLYETQIPGITLIPGITVITPDGHKAFKINQDVRMQSTGPRQMHPGGVAFTLSTIFP